MKATKTIAIGGPIMKLPPAEIFPFATLARWGAGNDWTLQEVHRSEADAKGWQDAYMGAAPEMATVLRANIRVKA